MMAKRVRVTVVAALVLAVTATAAWRSTRPAGSTKATTLAVALASRDGSTVVDRASNVTHRNAVRIRAETAATASASCTGCAARAVSLQIVYARSTRHATAENVATAWSSCTTCSAGALALQIVVAARPGVVIADNRAFAADAACTGCSTTAIAYQIVVISRSGKQLSAAARHRIEAIRAELEATLIGPSAVNGPMTPAAAPSTVGELVRIVEADTGARAATIHSDVEHG